MVSVPFSSWEVEEFSATLARNRTGVDMAHGLPLPRGRVEGNHDLCPSPPHYYYYLLFLDECRETDRERGKGREREREREDKVDCGLQIRGPFPCSPILCIFSSRGVWSHSTLSASALLSLRSKGAMVVAQSFSSFPAEVYGHFPPFLPLPF